MKKTPTLWLASLMVGGMLISPTAMADDRSAEEIIESIKGVELPAYDRERGEDEAFMQRYWELYGAANRMKAAYILELHQSYPDHESIVKYLPQRWMSLIGDEQLGETVESEMAKVLETQENSPLAIEALYCRVQKSMQDNLWVDEQNLDQLGEDFEIFIAAAPEDTRCAQLLMSLAGYLETGGERQMVLYKRIKKDYPDYGSVKYIDGKLRQHQGIGKPFELAFTDAITGTKISMADLRGQVVVIDYWATWCGPCIAEMPHMKELYAKYHDQGVEFIGVSLDNNEDRGGLTALKEYVAKNEVPWPQYYQGNGWAGEFSVSWGINSIPALFIIDKHGNLHSTQARGELEELIPELLGK